jgi:hypothetical protein
MTSSPITDPEDMPVAVRAWAVADYLKHLPNARERNASRPFVDLGPSEWTLTFDTETTTDLSLRLRVGAYQLRRHGVLKKTGLFVDTDVLTTDELALVREYGAARGFPCLTRAEFVEKVLLRYAHSRRALVVGFNLPFDISRIAIDHGPAKGDRRMRGGFTFTITARPDAPHVQIKRAGTRAAFIRFTIPVGRSAETRNRERGGTAASNRGYFVDVSVAAGALLGQRYKLGRLAEVLNTEHRKLEIETYDTAITSEFLDYLCLDVQVTWECFEILQGRYRNLGLTQTPLYRIYSEAGIGKALLRELGLTPWRRLQPDVPGRLLATIMESYYGGRSECRIRKTAVPGSYVDFSSEYPLCFVLMQLWEYLSSTGIKWRREDPAEVNRMLNQLTPDQLLDQGFWPQLQKLVRIAPEEDRLPTRARYKNRRLGPFNVALSFRSAGPQQWFTLADACASKLMTGKAPRVVEVLHFATNGERQEGLQPVDFGGDARYRIDPNRDDPIKRLVELRAIVRADAKHARGAGNEAQADRLDGTQQAIKATANSVAYGTPIELNVIEHRRPVGVTITHPDATRYHSTSRRIEEPGEWFHPLIGTLVAGAGRLLLATLMALVQEAGGNYAFCDTDSLFIVDLTQDQVDEIIARFQALNPYDTALIPGSILKLEDENFDPDTGARRDPICLGLATKRTAQFIFDANGRPKLVGNPSKRRRSEHGLGHLRLPEHPDLGTAPALDEWWEHTICQELAIDHDEPPWFGQEAIGTRAVTSLHDDNAFARHNRGRHYPDGVRPFNFHNIAHPTRIERSRRNIRCLISQYETDPEKYRVNDWYDRGNDKEPRPFRITTNELDADDDDVVVQTFRDYFNDHRLHSDGKMLDPADGRPCHPWTRGPLEPRHITATHLLRVGKESNPLVDADSGPGDDTDGLAFEYRERICPGCGAPVEGRRKWCSEACRKRAARVKKSVTTRRR